MDAHHSTIAVRTFQGADEEQQRELIPDAAGLYLWTHDLNQFLGADELFIQPRLKEMLELVGRPRNKVVRPYYAITVGDKRVPIRDSKRMFLQEAFASAEPFGEWLAQIMTRFQRPLYAGMTRNLFRRTQEHLAQGSMFRMRLEAAGADLLDLAVTWVPLPELNGPNRSDLSDDELKRYLQAAESLLIRLTMPMFNERQD